MTKLEWDRLEDRHYEAGVSRGAFYLPDVVKQQIDINKGFNDQTRPDFFGFEAGWDSNPAWGFYTRSDLEWDPTFGRKKPGSLKVTFNGGETTAKWIEFLKAYAPIGSMFRFKVWVFTPSGVTSNPAAESLNNDVPHRRGPRTTVARDGWTELDWIFESTDDMAYVGVHWNNTVAGQTVWLDDPTLEVIERTPGHAWNGIISVDESYDGGEREPHFFDGIKYADFVGVRHFKGTIRSYSSPPEFGPCVGEREVRRGFVLTRQPKKRFNFAYRSGVDGVNYKLHLIYNALATPGASSYQTLSSSPSPVEKEFLITAVPPRANWYKPTAHFIVDSRKTSISRMQALEDILYGTETTDPRFPEPLELNNLLGNLIAEPIYEPI